MKGITLQGLHPHEWMNGFAGRLAPPSISLSLCDTFCHVMVQHKGPHQMQDLDCGPPSL